MIMIVLIAIAAGCASALMFASVISGALISLLLLYFAPLPLMVAALGWGPLASTIGGIMAATGLGLVFGLPLCIAFAVMMALPAWWLGHLALLGRPMANAATINGSGAKYSNGSEISAPEKTEANISADAQPATMAMRTVMIISCPAPFERLEVLQNPNHRRPDDPEAL